MLIFHALSGDAHVSGVHEDGRSGWWDLMVGPGRAFDTDRYFILCANVLGGCKGSTGPGVDQSGNGPALRPRFSGHHAGRHGAGAAAAAGHLGIERLHAVAGGSMGGMLTLAFAQLYPEMAERAIVMAASCDQPRAGDRVEQNRAARDHERSALARRAATMIRRTVRPGAGWRSRG